MYLNKAIDQVRRSEVKHHDEMKNTRYALFKNPENLTEIQRIKFESIISTNYEVRKALQVRENFKELFSSENFLPGHYITNGLLTRSGKI
jgi:transposase